MDRDTRHRRSIRLRGYDYTQAGVYFITVCVKHRACLFGDVVGGVMRLNEAGQRVQSVWDDLPLHYPHLILDAFVVMPNHVHGIVVLTNDADDKGAGLKPAPTQPETTALLGHANVGAGFKPARTEPKTAVLLGHANVGAGFKPARMEPETAALLGCANVGAGFKPARTEPARTEPARTEPARTEPARTEPARTEPARTEPARTQPTLTKRHDLSEIVRAFKTFSARRINALHDAVGTPVWQRNYFEHIIRDEGSLNDIRQYITNNPAQWDLDRENPRWHA
jgi:REP element-mobilizing transposase RayT